MSQYINKEKIQEHLDSITFRPWQQASLDDQAIVFENQNIFVQETVTGGGKTFLGICSALRMINAGLIDRVIIMSPSVEIRDGWSDGFDKRGLNVSCDTDEIADKVGYTVTYHAAIPLSLGNDRTLLIIDEFHHAERDETWGRRVNSMAAACGYCLCLTATPWMTTGTIALMEKNKYYVDGVIEPDSHHRYGEDLKLGGNDRATVPVNFEFFDSEAYEKPKKGEIPDPTIFESPGSDAERWKELADPACTKPLTPHVHINDDDNELKDNSMAYRMMWRGVNALENARAKTKRKAIGLVVAKSIREAKRLGEFIEIVLQQSVKVIVSDDDDSAKNLKEIRSAKNKPDWVVSVGIVSEGVDIPEIKVIVYLSAITTDLYLVQVIGRSIRRINIGTVAEPHYLDEDVHSTEATVLMPAHPRLLYVAWLFEDEKRKALEERAEKKDPKDPPGGPQPGKEYENTGGTESVGMHRGHSFDRTVSRLIDALADDPEASAVCTAVYVAWVKTLETGYAIGELREKCQQFGIDPDSIVDMDLEHALTYDQRVALAKTNSKRIAALIRFSHPKFKDVHDNGNPFGKVRAFINKESGVCWKKATLDDREEWLRVAEEIYRNGK